MNEGGCLCGGVRFAYEGGATPIQFCHAKRCQRASGSAFQPEMAVAADGFRWLQGEDQVEIYEAPLLREPPALRRAFCRVCGSPVPVVREGQPWVALLAGSLDGDPERRGFRHIFLSQSAAWYEVPDDELKHYEERPPAAERLRWRKPEGG
ncbi:MAG: GFA family protein [Deltaproteobacteria bacterium]|nr:GFA family protein [Deltaproteobacteria bacterium]